ncbi:MAG: Fe-S cluster assembly ATP-binding protein [Candidatus Krumholzibacteriia bacterium]|jgi:Fe-S cluster assembly ATP-binding protein
MLRIKDLHASTQGQKILQGIDLEIKPGEVHAIMGPNGAGKSTLSQVLAGNETYDVTAGSVDFDGQDLLALDAHERALEGLFLAFQYPVEIPGFSNEKFVRTSLNALRRHRGEPELDAYDFAELAKEKASLMEMDPELLTRGLNVGFSGGEKKRNECFQMAIMEPRLAILDETDSGLDIDALRIVAHGVNALRRDDRAVLMITHYQRLLDYIVPDYVHVLAEGRIVRSGGKELALELEKSGYGWLQSEPAAADGEVAR